MGNYADRVCETTNTTGTGTLTLEGAVDGYQTFVAGIGDATTCKYCITDGFAWEVGEGTVTDASSDTLSRDTIEASSNSGSAVNWGSGEKTVFHVFSATDFDHPEITDLTLSGGLYVGGTGAANYLEDYEKGDYTPAMTFATSGSISYDSRSGEYIKKGREATVIIQIKLNGETSPSGYIKISVPFTMESDIWPIGTIRYNDFSGLSNSYGDVIVYGYATANSIVIGQSTTAGGNGNVDGSVLTGNEELWIELTYFTAS